MYVKAPPRADPMLRLDTKSGVLKQKLPRDLSLERESCWNLGSANQSPVNEAAELTRHLGRYESQSGDLPGSANPV